MKEHGYLIAITAAGVLVGLVAFELTNKYVLKPHVFKTA